jgi:hypothetical protein
VISERQASLQLHAGSSSEALVLKKPAGYVVPPLGFVCQGAKTAHQAARLMPGCLVLERLNESLQALAAKSPKAYLLENIDR